MTDTQKVDICVIGGGSGGLSVAAGASQMGANVTLFESAKMGGDCLNYGCVPSKALLAAAKAMAHQRDNRTFGIHSKPGSADFEGIKAHVTGVIDAIAPMDSVERFEGLGVRVVEAPARFTGPQTVEGGGFKVNARRFVIATGSKPAIPPIPGLVDGPYLTNETIFDLEVLPDHLLIIGGGPNGIEMAQAFHELGARVTIVEMFSILTKDDPELVKLLRRRLTNKGIEIIEGAAVRRVAHSSGHITLTIASMTDNKPPSVWQVVGTHLLVTTGRRPSVDGLDLEVAGIDSSQSGITVDARLRTTNRNVFAIGDVAGPHRFTHVAGYHASIVIRNALFRLPIKVDYRAVPWVTYTDPELASVGLDETQARYRHGKIAVLRWPFAETDRAQAERMTTGLVKVITTPRGKILGATILGSHAGELIQTWCLAIQQGLKIGAMARVILPYPTLGEANKRVAASFYTPKLFGPGTKRIVRFLSRFG